MWPIVTNALESGLALSAILFGLLLLILRVNPEILLNDYPPDIRNKWGLIRAHTKRQRVTFGVAFTHFAVMFGTFNVLDWVVLDWSLVYWQPRFVVLPGTEGMAGYIPIVLVGSALLAAMVSTLA